MCELLKEGKSCKAGGVSAQARVDTSVAGPAVRDFQAAMVRGQGRNPWLGYARPMFVQKRGRVSPTASKRLRVLVERGLAGGRGADSSRGNEQMRGWDVSRLVPALAHGGSPGGGDPFAAGRWGDRLSWTPQPALLPSAWTRAGRSGAPVVTLRRGRLKHGRQLCAVSAQAFTSGFSDCAGGGGEEEPGFVLAFPGSAELLGVLSLVGPVGRSSSQWYGRPAAPDSASGCPGAGRGNKAVCG